MNIIYKYFLDKEDMTFLNDSWVNLNNNKSDPYIL